MHLDVITDKGKNKRMDTEKQTEFNGMHLFSVPIGIDVATENPPNPKPNAPLTIPKSREQLSDTNTATKLTTTVRKERAKAHSCRRLLLKKNTQVSTCPTIGKVSGKKRGLEVEEKVEISEKNADLESRKRQKYQDVNDNLQTPTAAAASQPRREQ